MCVQVYISLWGLKLNTHRLMGTRVTVGPKLRTPWYKASKSYRVSFFERVKCRKFPVRAKFRCRVGVGDRKYSLYSIQTITPMESPHKDS